MAVLHILWLPGLPSVNSVSCDLHPGWARPCLRHTKIIFVIMGVMVCVSSSTENQAVPAHGMALYCFLTGGFLDSLHGFWLHLNHSRNPTELCVLKQDISGLRLKQAINIKAQGYSLQDLSQFHSLDLPDLWKKWIFSNCAKTGTKSVT